MTLERKFHDFASSLHHGECIDSLPNHLFKKEKADYLLYDRGLVLEVKYLTEDRGRTVSEKLNELANSDPSFPQFFGTIHVEEVIRSHRDRENFRHWICNYAAKTLADIVRKANRQIRMTKEALDLERSTGVLVLLNEGVQLYDDDFVFQEVSRLLHKERDDFFEHQHVEVVWYLNEYATATTRRGSSSAFIGPAARNDQADRFMNMLHVAWCAKNGYAMKRGARS
jgi:hypothetical protein